MTTPPETLADSPSPFLRHGAEQPVDWLPWGEAAFRRASEEDRPVLLDIGAVWCHWCHVMDRESYEDPETAALINELYVPVKVDRDERPDVDSRYQRAVQTLIGQGGWPLTAFLTPDGEVFHGGTYFPPEDRHGRPGFPRVLREVARVWLEDRERVRGAVGAVHERLAQVLTGEAEPGPLDRALLDDAETAFSRSYDAARGGFGGAPKFPNPGGLDFLLDRWVDTGSESARRMVVGTLTAMVRGGIHDHLGGGFHRYSTDARWIIPHFEKMAYDNGPLLGVLARAAATLDGPELAEAAERVVAHYRDIAPELVAEGGFPASQDADIGPDDDGDYWTWTEAEIVAALGEEEAEAALIRWGLHDAAGSMHLDPERHVLFAAAEVEEVARRLGRPESEVATALETARRRLKEVRDRRPAPLVDTTLYSGWVSLVASGHLAAARHLGIREAGEDALRAMDRVWREAWRDGVGLSHRVGDAGSGVMLADQAHAARALLDAFELSQDTEWLDRARSLLDVVLDRFGHPSGGLVDLPVDDGTALGALGEARLEITDAPEPSPTAVAAESLARLAAFDHDPEYAEAARSILHAYAGFAPRFATSAPTFFGAVRWVLGPVTTVVVVEREAPGALLGAALEAYRPATVVRSVEPGASETARLPDAVRAMLTGAAPRAYVCAGTRCAPPVAEPGELAELIRTFSG